MEEKFNQMDYKNYSLENLKNWLHDCLSAGEASPQEIYDVIKEVVTEEYHYYKNGASKTNELLSLLNGTVQFNLTDYNTTYFDDMNYCNNSLNDFGVGTSLTEDKIEFHTDPKGNDVSIKKWVVPVEVDSPSGEYFVTLPDDLIEKVGWQENDTLDWVDNGDGSWTLKRVETPTSKVAKV
jgi:hypothetical protein